LGSAIFVHLGEGKGMPTAGCVAMAEPDLLSILQWLDPARRPLIIMGTYEELLK
jgi:L,D-peptidoglycan transpeptidase YkuD (ErfK/YbiS/YcfS/YnhG family)